MAVERRVRPYRICPVVPIFDQLPPHLFPETALSDASAPNYANTSLANIGDGPSAVYTITYGAKSWTFETPRGPRKVLRKEKDPAAKATFAESLVLNPKQGAAKIALGAGRVMTFTSKMRQTASQITNSAMVNSQVATEAWAGSLTALVTEMAALRHLLAEADRAVCFSTEIAAAVRPLQ